MFSFFKKVFYEINFDPRRAFEQCIVRNFLQVLVITTTLIAQYFGGIGELDDLVVYFSFAYLAISFSLTALVHFYHGVAKPISIIGVITDTFIICFIMYMGSDREAALYGLLIFLVVANGVRFGKVYMQFANLVCIIGFLIVVSFNEFWREHILLSVGNIMWLIIIPAHLSNLLTYLEDAISSAEAANRAKTSFIANMSHEIRTPLTSIIGFSRTLLNKEQSSVKKENALEAIIRNGEHLTAIINDILDISKIEAGKLELDRHEFSIIEVIHEIDLLFRQRIESEGLAFTINYNFPIPDKIFSDSLRIKQILINLCSNAIKFTNHGGITIDISFDTDNRELLFAVTDSGIGLSQSKTSDIFLNFSQADISTTREYGGTGLGLSISARLAEMLEGKLWVESELGKGSIFYLTVSIGEAVKPKLLNALPELKHETVSTKSSRVSVEGKILLVDDVVDNQLLIGTLLEDMGAQVDIVDNGLIALEKTSQENYDLVLLDLQMPVMGGMEALNKMRENNYTNPVVILTANVIQNEERESRDVGCQGFLSKPIDENKLTQTVLSYLKDSHIKISDVTKDNKLAEKNMDESVIISHLLTEKDKDDFEKYKKLAEAFSLQLYDRIKAIENAHKSNNDKLLKELIHSLKGVGGNMGYNIVTDISADIERATLNNEKNKIDALIEELYSVEKKILAGLS